MFSYFGLSVTFMYIKKKLLESKISTLSKKHCFSPPFYVIFVLAIKRLYSLTDRL